MTCFATFVCILMFSRQTLADEPGVAVANNGEVAVGRFSGGVFGLDNFSISKPGRSGHPLNQTPPFTQPPSGANEQYNPNAPDFNKEIGSNRQDGMFSIGHGQNNVYGDAGDGKPVVVNVYDGDRFPTPVTQGPNSAQETTPRPTNSAGQQNSFAFKVLRSITNMLRSWFGWLTFK